MYSNDLKTILDNVPALDSTYATDNITAVEAIGTKLTAMDTKLGTIDITLATITTAINALTTVLTPEG
jgi:hypothetical protein